MTILTEDRLDRILEQARGVKVAVIGDLMLDVYLTGSVTRISPEAPVPVVHVTEERVALGGAANVAANVARLGACCDVVGYLGNDAAGTQLHQALVSLKGGDVVPRVVRRGERPTTTKTRVVARNQQVVRFDREEDDDLPGDCARELCAILEEVIPTADVVALEDYDKGVLTPEVVATALRAARAAGLPVVVDPKFRHVFQYRGATVFKPNAAELQAAIGGQLRPHDDDWLRKARERFDCEHLLVTLGEHGMVLSSADGAFRVPTTARQVFDVSGAGDTVTACLAVAIAAGATIREAAVLANFAAGIEVGKHGVASVAPEEIREVLADHNERAQPSSIATGATE